MSRERFVRITMELLYSAMILALVTWSPKAHADDAEHPAIAQWEDPTSIEVHVGKKMLRWWPVDESLSAWSSTGVVNFVPVTDPSLADVKVRRWKKGETPEGYAGLATYDFHKTPDGRSFNGYFDWCTVWVDRAIPMYARQNVLVHELGHCVGLNDNFASANVPSVMSYDYIWSIDHPTTVDIEWARAIYANPPYDEPSVTEVFPPEGGETNEGTP